ncbi:MAG: aldo/keto reductase [Pseudomonadota bacterium]|nr:aldo/keto reductase [Pseudomonadota bacterium]
MSSIYLGTWQASSSSWSTSDIASVRDAVAHALDSGLTCFDTSPGYADGAAESLLGELLPRVSSGLGRVLTKVPPDMLTAPLVRKSVEDSLQRLRTDCVDTVFIHWPAGSMGTDLVPVDETLDALDALREEGKIAHVGLSNFSAAEARQILARRRIDAFQHCYSLLWRAPEHGLLDLAREYDVRFYAYSPVATGLLFLRKIDDVLAAESDHRKHTKLFGAHAQHTRDTVQQLSERYCGDGAALAVASLRWLLAKQATPILGIKDRRSVELATAAVQAGPLPEEDVACLDALTCQLKEIVGEDYCLWG